MKERINLDGRLRCPRCDGAALKNWAELSDEEKQVVQRKPASGQESLRQRQRSHRWCTRCWFESSGDEDVLA